MSFDKAMARLNSVSTEAQRELEQDVDTGEAGRQPSPQQDVDEALEDEAMIVLRPNGTNTAVEIERFPDAMYSRTIFQCIAVDSSAIATRNGKG